MPGANDAGTTRGERLAALVSSWRNANVEVAFEVLPRVAHDLEPMVAPTTHFFDRILTRDESA